MHAVRVAALAWKIDTMRAAPFPQGFSHSATREPAAILDGVTALCHAFTRELTAAPYAREIRARAQARQP